MGFDNFINGLNLCDKIKYNAQIFNNNNNTHLPYSADKSDQRMNIASGLFNIAGYRSLPLTA